MINKGPSHSNQLTNHHKPPANYSQTNQSTINNNIITTITTINNNTNPTIVNPSNINNNNQLPQPHHQSTPTNNPAPQIHPSSFPFLIWARPKNNIFYNSNCLFIWFVGYHHPISRNQWPCHDQPYISNQSIHDINHISRSVMQRLQSKLCFWHPRPTKRNCVLEMNLIERNFDVFIIGYYWDLGPIASLRESWWRFVMDGYIAVQM